VDERHSSSAAINTEAVMMDGVGPRVAWGAQFSLMASGASAGIHVSVKQSTSRRLSPVIPNKEKSILPLHQNIDYALQST